MGACLGQSSAVREVLAPVFTKGVQRNQPHAQKGPGAAASTGQSREGSHQRGEMGQSGPVPSAVGQGPSGNGDERSLRVVWAPVGAGRRAVGPAAPSAPGSVGGIALTEVFRELWVS